MNQERLPLSILNLAPRYEGESAKEAIERVGDLAVAAEGMGYTRYWIAEHHNFAGVMSSATDLIMGYVLSRTERIRVGSGGVMLPNHVPLQVAERFGTLATLYPDRVDLGLGRAPGTDRQTNRVLNTGSAHSSKTFPEDVEALQIYFSDEEEQGPVRAYPGVGTHVPLYILGSSFVSAELAGRMGLPYAFAAHFSDHPASDAFAIYEKAFRPSRVLSRPYKIACVNTVVAESDEEADYWYTTAQQMYLINFSGGGQSRLIAKPDPDFRENLSSARKILLDMRHGTAFVGAVETVQSLWQRFQERHQVQELMTVSYIHDTKALIHSYELLQQAVNG